MPAAKEKKATPQELMGMVNDVMPGAVQLASDPQYVVRYLPTSIMPLDFLLQGGLPRGRHIEVYGDYSSLKSYMAYRAIAETQRQNLVAGLVDTEHSFDPVWAVELGVDLKSLVLSRPPSGEEAVDASEVLIRGGIDLLVFDSVAATLPRSEGELQLSGKQNIQPARLAALMSTGLRKLTTANKHTALMWINQTRLNVGVSFGNPESIPGGKALPFYASMRIAMRKAGKKTRDVHVYDGTTKKAAKETWAQTIRCTLEKSKLNKPYREVLFDYDLGMGEIDEIGFLLNQAQQEGFILSGGGYWWHRGAKKKQRLADFRNGLDVEDLKNRIMPSPSGAKPVVKSKAVRLRRAT